jgi:hypothetical protein
MNARLVKTLADEEMQQGVYQLTWIQKMKKEMLPVQEYILNLQTGNYSENKKDFCSPLISRLIQVRELFLQLSFIFNNYQLVN